MKKIAEGAVVDLKASCRHLISKGGFKMRKTMIIAALALLWFL
jgi:hypothetical protein